VKFIFRAKFASTPLLLERDSSMRVETVLVDSIRFYDVSLTVVSFFIYLFIFLHFWYVDVYTLRLRMPSSTTDPSVHCQWQTGLSALPQPRCRTVCRQLFIGAIIFWQCLITEVFFLVVAYVSSVYTQAFYSALLTLPFRPVVSSSWSYIVTQWHPRPNCTIIQYHCSL